MKKMLKRLGVVIPSTILTLLMAVGFSTPAFAYVDTTAVAEEPVQVVEEAEPTEEEKIPFTIAGNGEVEDNIVDGASLKAAGYTCEGRAGGLEWNGAKAPKQADQYPRQMKTRWVKKKEGLHGS